MKTEHSIMVPLPADQAEQVLLDLLEKGTFNGWFADANLAYTARIAENIVPNTTLQMCSNGPHLIGDQQKCADIYTGAKTVEKVAFDLVLLSSSAATAQLSTCVKNGYSGNVSLLSNAYQNDTRWYLEKVTFRFSPELNVVVQYQPEHGGDPSRLKGVLTAFRECGLRVPAWP